MRTFIDNAFESRELYREIVAPVCDRFSLTYSELCVLLFLGNDVRGDTASDITKCRGFTKSTVSACVRSLQERGLISGRHTDGNRRSIHLRVCGCAEEILAAGREAHELYFKVLTSGFLDEERELLMKYLKRISVNISDYLKYR